MRGLETGDLDEALARTGDGVFVIGGDGRIILWNRAAERILGFTEREVRGKPCCDVFAGCDEHGNRVCHPDCHISTLTRAGEPVQSFDMRTRTKTGRAVWLNVSTLASPAHDGGGPPTTIHLFRDVTAAKELLTLVHERLAAATRGDRTPAPDQVLTRREVDVLRLLAAGAATRAAAERLHVSTATIRNHVQNLFAKLGVHSRLEAVAYAHRHRLL